MKLFFRATFALLGMTACAHAVPVTLRVVDANNAPIVGASVEIMDYADVVAKKLSQSPTANARTAKDGSLVLDLKGAQTQLDSDGFDITAAPNPALGAARVRVSGHGFRNVLLVGGENNVQLTAATRLSGTVEDEKGAPLAGARIELVKVEKGTNQYDDIRASTGFAPVVATTDTDGTWKFEGVSRGYATLLVSAPGKVAAALNVRLDAPDKIAPPLKLQAAGTVRGRILDVNGRALSGVSVSFDAQMDGGTLSDDNGEFFLPGVPVGENSLNFWGSRGDWLGVDEPTKVTVPDAGVVVDVGEVRAGNGILVVGNLQKQDGEPWANFAFQVGDTRFRTDATGHFEGRVGKHSYFATLPEGYVLVTDSPYLPPESKNVDVGAIVVARGANVPLDIRDENGRALPQATVGFDSKTRRGNSVFDGARARSTPLIAGDYEIKGRGLWQVIEPQTLSVALPEAIEKAEPLRIVVRRLAPTQVSGRVVDARGNGLAGAKISVSANGYGTSRELTSGEDGRFQFEFPLQGRPYFLGVIELEDYKVLRGGERDGEWTQQDDAEKDLWQAADIVMARTDVTFTGRVVDENGAGVAGARISWGDAPKFDVIATDANGKFEIKGLPDAPIVVRASDGARLDQTIATPRVPLEIKLPNTMRLSDAELEKMLTPANAEQLKSLVFYADIIGESRVLEAVELFNAWGNPTEIGALDNYLKMLAFRARTPDSIEGVARQGVRLLRKFPFGQTLGDGAGRIALMAARSQDAGLRAWAQQWVDAQKSQLSLQRVTAAALQNALRVATVGATLGRADANDALSIALFINQRLPSAGRTDSQTLGALLWGGDPQWLDEAIEDWAPSA